MKYKIGKNCMPCWAGYSDTKQKLPRKKKKLLKRVYEHAPDIHPFVPLCRCNTNTYWKEAKKWIPHLSFLDKNKELIAKVFSDLENVLEPCTLDIVCNELSLMWSWEDDNGLYCTDGDMAAIWDQRKQDSTWSYDETMSLLSIYNLENKNIKSFKQFINHLKRKL